MAPAPTISVCMIVKDEEKFISKCLESLKPFVDEIIVVDTGSRDRTVEIAKSFGAKVFVFGWRDDFSAARNESLRHASSDWIIVVDADEVIAPGEMEGLREVLSSTDAWGLEIQQRNYTEDTSLYGWQPCDGRPECEGPGFFVSPIVRIFRNSPKVRFRNRVHEEVDTSIVGMGKKVEMIPFPVHHYGYLKGDAVLRQKREKYLRLGLEQIGADAGDPKPLYEVGNIHLHEGRFKEAEGFYRKVIALDPMYKIVFTNLGEALFKQGKVKEAVAAYEESIKRVPRNENAYINLGMIVYDQGMVEPAIALFRRAIDINPTSATAYNNLIIAQMKLERYGEAVVTLSRAIEATGLEKFKAVLAKIKANFPEEFAVQERIKTGDFAGAEAALRKRLEKDPLDIVTLTNLGLVFSKSGEPEKIVELFERPIEKSGKDKSPLWINLRVNLANAYVELGEIEKAKDVLRRAIELNPQKIDFLRQRLQDLEES